MSIAALLIAALATCIAVWLVQQGRIPAPFVWLVYAVLIVIWLLVLIQVLGVSRFGLT